MHVLDPRVMRQQSPPCKVLCQFRHARHRPVAPTHAAFSALLFVSIAASRSCQDDTNPLAPSDCSCAASASMSTPALPIFGEHRLGIAAVARHHAIDLPVIGERQQRLFRHGVDSVRRREGLRCRARPRPSGPWCRCWRTAGVAVVRPILPAAASGRTQQVAICLVGLPRDRDAQACCSAGPARLSIVALSQRLTNSEATERTSGLRPAATRRSSPFM